jgi:hypothetical protein
MPLLFSKHNCYFGTQHLNGTWPVHCFRHSLRDMYWLWRNNSSKFLFVHDKVIIILRVSGGPWYETFLSLSMKSVPSTCFLVTEASHHVRGAG